MPEYVLVIDESSAVVPVIELAVSEAGINVARADNPQAARRRIMIEAPRLILIHSQIGEDEEAGLKFCKGLKEHPTFAAIPVFILSKKVDDQLVATALQAGAKAMIPWPLEEEALRTRLVPVLPELTARSRQPQPSQRPAATKQRSAEASHEIEFDGDDETEPESGKVGESSKSPTLSGEAAEKFKLAQQLMAQALHTLKTSNLLEVVDKEDLPGVILEITRNICASAENSLKKG